MTKFVVTTQIAEEVIEADTFFVQPGGTGVVFSSASGAMMHSLLNTHYILNVRSVRPLVEGPPVAEEG